MDGQRFDDVVKALARGASRRKLLRGLATGVIGGLFAGRGRTVAAQGWYYLSAGDPCFDDAQCRAADTPMYCADNGFDYDGPLNCCAFEGSRCSFDEGCCGSAICVSGVCGYAVSGGYNPETGDPGIVYNLGPGDACLYDEQCGNNYPEYGIMYCDDNGYVYGPYGGTKHCCRYYGGTCGGPLSDFHQACCGDLLCTNGQCGWG